MASATETEKLGYAWKAWERACNEGYVNQAIKRRVGEECFNLLVGGLVGVVAAVGGVMVCSAAGAAAGAAIGGYFSAGNPAAITATAELGATIGRTIAETALVAIGVYSVAVYMVDHMWEIGRLAIAAYDIAVNQLPIANGDLYNVLLDLAARWFAEAVGLFCGFLVFAIAMLVMARVATSKEGQTRSQAVKDLFDSKLNEMCKGIVQWIVPRAQDLRYKMQPAGKVKFAVINGGIGPENMSLIQRSIIVTRRVMPKLVSPKTKMVVFENFPKLHECLVNEGFKLTEAKPWGPPGGQQLFYERNNICVRVKTLGDAGGPRANTPHLSMGVNDGLGTAWVNDLAKVAADGKLTFKLDIPHDKFSPFERITDPNNPTLQRFVGIIKEADAQGGSQKMDAWGKICHFNLPGNFQWTGLDAVLKSVPKKP
ncbi:MAG: hypothetical protein NW208_13595 [Bryobacter sp.]|nr:hypothetical protein [Bryobacter sp.]